jgi:hypothetical protein
MIFFENALSKDLKFFWFIRFERCIKYLGTKMTLNGKSWNYIFLSEGSYRRIKWRLEVLQYPTAISFGSIRLFL